MEFDAVSYDRDADTLYVQLSGENVGSMTALDDLRLIDYDAQKKLVGIEFH